MVAVEAIRKALRQRTTNTTEQYCARIRTNDAFAYIHRAFANKVRQTQPPQQVQVGRKKD